MDHHLRDRQVLEIEEAAEHVALDLRDAALLVQQVDLAADLLGGREDRLVLADADAEGQQHEPTSRSMAMASGPSSATTQDTGREQEQRDLVGRGDRQVFGSTSAKTMTRTDITTVA